MRKIVIALCGILMLGFGSACAASAEMANAPDEVSSRDAVVGVVETSGSEKKSFVRLYSEQLHSAGSIEIDQATMGSYFYKSCVFDEVLYISPLGYANEKDNAEILGISLNDLSVKSYKTKRPAMTVAANDHYAFGCGNVNGSSYIESVDKKSGEVHSAEFLNQYVDLIIWADDSLFAFGSKYGPDGLCGATISRLDENLKVTRVYDIAEFGSESSYAVVYEGALYFSYSSEVSDASGLGVLDLETGDTRSIDLDASDPAALLIYDGKLYIAHQDLVANSNESKGVLSLYDFESEKVETKELPFGPYQMALSCDDLYFLDVAQRAIYRCDARSLDLLESIQIDSKGEEYTYLTNLFAIGRG